MFDIPATYADIIFDSSSQRIERVGKHRIGVFLARLILGAPANVDSPATHRYAGVNFERVALMTMGSVVFDSDVARKNIASESLKPLCSIHDGSTQRFRRFHVAECHFCWNGHINSLCSFPSGRLKN